MTEVYITWGNCKMAWPTLTQWLKFILLAVTARWPDPLLPEDWSLYCLRWLQDDLSHFYAMTEVYTARGYCKMTWSTFTKRQKFILLGVTARWRDPLLSKDRSLYCLRWLQDDLTHFYPTTEVYTSRGNCKMTWSTVTKRQKFILLEVAARWPDPLLPNDRSLYYLR